MNIALDTIVSEHIVVNGRHLGEIGVARCTRSARLPERRSVVEVDDDSTTALIKHDVAWGDVVVRYAEGVEMIDCGEDPI